MPPLRLASRESAEPEPERGELTLKLERTKALQSRREKPGGPAVGIRVEVKKGAHAVVNTTQMGSVCVCACARVHTSHPDSLTPHSIEMGV